MANNADKVVDVPIREIQMRTTMWLVWASSGYQALGGQEDQTAGAEGLAGH